MPQTRTPSPARIAPSTLAYPTLFARHPANPVLTEAHWPYPVNTVFNPAAAQVDGETVLLCRVEDRRGISHLTVARSPDGVAGWRIDDKPLIGPHTDDPHVRWGAEDPRITRVDELDAWVIAYRAYGSGGPAIALALTRDFHDITPLGVAMPPDDTDAALLPRRVAGDWVLLHRPRSPMSGRADVWLSRSADLRSWHGARAVLTARPTPWWDSGPIGFGAAPIDTPLGWLGAYHGVKRVGSRSVSHVGLVLLDRDDPAVVRHRSTGWIFGPAAPYELVGDAPNVIVPTGLLHDRPTGLLHLYYGAADTCVALATARLDDVLDYLTSQPPT